MRRCGRNKVVGLAAAVTMVVPMALMGGTAAVGAVPSNEAVYEMNEAPGTTTMFDSSGNGLHASVNPDGLTVGVTSQGATGYEWAYAPPSAPPARPERVIRVPDNPHLDPAADAFTVEIRYKTTRKFGNIIQKGQSADKGGQWKIQNPQGRPSCLFKDGNGRRAATRSKVALNDGQWHTLTCVRTTSRVTMYVDGSYMSRKVGTTGTIDNRTEMTIGGKIKCNQTTVTCDYFTGMIDYVRLTRG